MAILDDVKTFLHLTGTQSDTVINAFITEVTTDFCNMRDWEKLKIAEVITLDDSDTYDLTAVLTATFLRELELIRPYSSTNTNTITKYIKYDYQNYERLSSKDYC